MLCQRPAVLTLTRGLRKGWEATQPFHQIARLGVKRGSLSPSPGILESAQHGLARSSQDWFGLIVAPVEGDLRDEGVGRKVGADKEPKRCSSLEALLERARGGREVGGLRASGGVEVPVRVERDPVHTVVLAAS